MSRLDPSIPLSVKQIQAPSPLESISRVTSLQDMMAQRDLRRQQVEEGKQKIEQEKYALQQKQRDQDEDAQIGKLVSEARDPKDPNQTVYDIWSKIGPEVFKINPKKYDVTHKAMLADLAEQDKHIDAQQKSFQTLHKAFQDALGDINADNFSTRVGMAVGAAKANGANDEAIKHLMDDIGPAYDPVETPKRISTIHAEAATQQQQLEQAKLTAQEKKDKLDLTAKTVETAEGPKQFNTETQRYDIAVPGGSKKKAEALTYTFHPQTGGLTSIHDPASGETYDASNVATAPPQVKARWDAIEGQQNSEAQKKAALEDKKFQETLTRQTQAFQNALDQKDYGEAKKAVSDSDKNYQDAIDRTETMDKNLIKAKQGDQQAMLSLVANHIGMTLGAQKGARINQAVWNEAISSTPWLQKIEAKFDSRGYLSGVTLAPAQMDSMVGLAHEKVDTLKDHKDRIDTEYRDVLSINKPNKKATAPATAAKIRVKRKSDGVTGTISESAFDPAKYDRVP